MVVVTNLQDDLPGDNGHVGNTQSRVRGGGRPRRSLILFLLVVWRDWRG